MGETNADEKIVENGTSDQDASQNAGGAVKEAEGAVTTDDDKGNNADVDTTTDKVEVKPTPADEEPKTRKRNVDFIIERKNKQIEKLKSKGNVANADEDDDDDDDDDLDISDKEIIDKRVAKVLTPYIQKQMQEEDANEISEFVAKNPDFAPYADRVKKYAQHPTRKDLPIKALFYEVAGDDLLMIGAKRAKELGDEAKESSAGGGSSQGGDGAKSVWDLTPEEFTAQQNALRNKSQ